MSTLPPGSGVVAPQFADLADATTSDQLAAKKRELDVNRAKYMDAATAEADAMKAASERQKLANKDVESAMAVPLPKPPEQPPIGPPPSRKLTDFLAPRDGEAPENTIMKLIQGIGLMASGIVGLRRGDATAALAGLHGALKGWQEGDQISADRHFADWDAAQKSLVAEWERRHKTYRDALEDHNLTVDQKLEIAKLRAIENGQDVAIETFNRKSVGDAISWLDSDKKSLEHMQEQAIRLREIRANKDEQRNFILQLDAQRAAEKRRARTEQINAVMPDAETTTQLGMEWFTTGKLSMGTARGEAGEMRRQAIIKAGIQWAKDNGIDPMSATAVRAEVASTRKALDTQRRNNATQEASLGRLEKHLATLIKLSDMVPRSEIPAVNQAIVAGEKNYKGSPEAAEYVAQAVEAAMEQARVQVPGSAQGDAASREEVRKTVAPELNVAQIKAVANRYIQNGRQSVESNREKEKNLLRDIETLGGRIQGPPMPPPPAGPPGDPLGVFEYMKRKKDEGVKQ